ncbi:DUF3817 domain-containing protein [Nocardia camponoti]|uniref:DUF3817 domain-containing protein n=1 Tax=Nocardia camponoti TaxID=1616106 RepID=A0A917QV33_9NOCA|nr:DUF3817 domain-containing protein [Nocardia camponoti]GGK69898.1 hypothetical protein GCM10011591_47560 [Nocardia camponoti]
MTSDNQTATAPKPPAGAAAKDKIATALTRYRVLAWITGVWLLVLVGEMVFKYLVLADSADAPGWFFYIAQAHGVFYMLYLVFTIDLAIKARWKPEVTVLTALAGTIPFLSFYVEHLRTKQVKAAFDIA